MASILYHEDFGDEALWATPLDEVKIHRVDLEPSRALEPSRLASEETRTEKSLNSYLRETRTEKSLNSYDPLALLHNGGFHHPIRIQMIAPSPLSAPSKSEMVMAVGERGSSAHSAGVHANNEKWEEAYAECAEYAPFYGRVTDPGNDGDLEGWSFEGSRLRRRGLIHVPSALVDEVIGEAHRAGHAGVEKTTQMLRRRYAFPISDADLGRRIRGAIGHCPTCQAVRPSFGRQPDERNFHPVPEEIFSSLSMDFVDLPPSSLRGKDVDQAMVIVDRTSGWVYAHPCLKAGFTAEQAANVFFDRIFHFFGLPNELLIAGDVALANSFIETVCALSGIERHICTRYRPSSNGRAECAVKAVVNSLRRVLEDFPRRWPEALPLALFHLNTLPGVTGTLSPFEILFGRVPVRLGEVPPLGLESSSYDGEMWLEKMQELRKGIALAVEEIHKDEKEKFERRHPPLTKFKIGDKVLVRKRDHEKDKLDAGWMGPTPILNRLHHNTYEVMAPEGRRQVVGSDLKLWLEPEGKSTELYYFKPRRGVRNERAPPLGFREADPDARRPAKLLQKRTVNGRTQFRIRWEGCGPEEDTWEALGNLVKFVPSEGAIGRSPSPPSPSMRAPRQIEESSGPPQMPSSSSSSRSGPPDGIGHLDQEARRTEKSLNSYGPEGPAPRGARTEKSLNSCRPEKSHPQDLSNETGGFHRHIPPSPSPRRAPLRMKATLDQDGVTPIGSLDRVDLSPDVRIDLGPISREEKGRGGFWRFWPWA
jgi:hypothetical protein